MYLNPVRVRFPVVPYLLVLFSNLLNLIFLIELNRLENNIERKETTGRVTLTGS